LIFFFKQRAILSYCHTNKQILLLYFLRSQRKRADRGQFWPSPKKVAA